MTFRTSISGLDAASAELNVFGHNIANANTVGFKSSRTEFAEIISSGLGRASVSDIGGVVDTGGGVKVGRIAQQFTQGNVEQTNNGLDFAINGQGFFVLEGEGNRYYSRAGAFGLEKDGYVANAKGERLIGFQVDTNGAISGSTGPIIVEDSNVPPNATTNVKLNLNLSSEVTTPEQAWVSQDSKVSPLQAPDPSTYNHSTSTTIYDSLGNSFLANMYFRKTDENTWDSYLYIDNKEVNTTSDPDDPDDPADPPYQLKFSAKGEITTPALGVIDVGPVAGVPGGGEALKFKLDFSDTTQFGSTFSVNDLQQDGNTSGRFTSLSIELDGKMLARFSNGQSKLIGQIALANFNNPQGLQPIGDTVWAETVTSGTPLVGAPLSSSLGGIQAGALESSNVELSEQLVKLIVAQRNYQANAEAIRTQNTLTQVLFNIR